MAGLIDPYGAAELITQLKANFDVPISLHTHYTSGMGSMAYLKAIEAGVDIVDTALSSLAMGSSQPPTEPLVAALRGTPYDTGLDLNLLTEINRHFANVRERYSDVAAPVQVNTEILTYQVPGGMLSNLRSQLAQQGLSHKLQEVFEEVPRVRADLGYPPLVTPMSQIVGTQAVLNVVSGERYSICSKRYATMCAVCTAVLRPRFQTKYAKRSSVTKRSSPAVPQIFWNPDWKRPEKRSKSTHAKSKMY